LVDVEVLSTVAPGRPAWDRNDGEIMRAGTSTGRTVTAKSKLGFGRIRQKGDDQIGALGKNVTIRAGE
jgi:hypothetical protein